MNEPEYSKYNKHTGDDDDEFLINHIDVKGDGYTPDLMRMR